MYNDTKIIIIYTMSNKLYIIFKVFFRGAEKLRGEWAPETLRSVFVPAKEAGEIESWLMVG